MKAVEELVADDAEGETPHVTAYVYRGVEGPWGRIGCFFEDEEDEFVGEGLEGSTGG